MSMDKELPTLIGNYIYTTLEHVWKKTLRKENRKLKGYSQKMEPKKTQGEAQDPGILYGTLRWDLRYNTQRRPLGLTLRWNTKISIECNKI